MNKELKEQLNEKIQAGEFSVVDIPRYLELFARLGNEVEDMQDEAEDWNRTVLFKLDELGTYWLTVKDGRFDIGEGEPEHVDFTLTMPAQEAVSIFTGDHDAEAAFMSGMLRIEGNLQDAIKINSLLEILAEEVEYA